MTPALTTRSTGCGATPSGTSSPTRPPPLPERLRRWIVDPLLAALLAPACAVCDRVLDRPLDGPVCGACWAGVRPVPQPVCDRCGGPLPSWRVLDGAVCPPCRARRGPVAATRAGGLYEGPLRAIVHALKYDGRRSLAGPLAALMRAAGPRLLAGASCAVPVPLHPWRRLDRGFNQAAALAGSLGLPVVAAVRRRRATRPQAGLSSSVRRANLHGAFGPTRCLPAKRAELIRDRTVLLVDDVRTTGATLDACADVLLGLGAKRVVALTAAWAGPTPPPARGA